MALFCICVMIFGMILVMIGLFNQAYDALLVGIPVFVVGIILFAIYLKISGKKIKAERDAKNNKFAAEEREQKSLSELRGLEKYLRMDKLEIEKEYESLRAIYQYAENLPLTVHQEKEKDWAILGGLADGIAGPVAGVATAAKTMLDNERIRQENNARMDNAVRKKFDLQHGAINASKNVRNPITMAELEKKYRADFWQSPAEFFNMLEFKTEKIEVQPDCDAIVLKTEWTRKENICIDGTIRAKLYDKDGLYAGCTYLVLPKEGTESSYGTIISVCAKPLHWNVTKVKYEPVLLWELAKADAPERESSYSDADADAYLLKNENNFQNEIEQSDVKYAEIKKKEKKELNKLKIKLAVGFVAVVVVIAAACLGVSKLNENKLKKLANEFEQECNNQLVSIIEGYYVGADVEITVTDIEKQSFKYYCATVRVDFNFNTETEGLDSDVLDLFSRLYDISDTYIEYRYNDVFPNGYESDSGDIVDLFNQNIADYMIYVYVNGELDSKPSNLYLLDE